MSPKTPEYGVAFEHWIHHELSAYLDYQQSRQEIRHYRNYEQDEVDFIVDDEIAIEAKGKVSVKEGDLSGLRVLQKEAAMKRRYVVCLEKTVRKTSDGIEILPYFEFIQRLWDGELLSSR